MSIAEPLEPLESRRKSNETEQDYQILLRAEFSKLHKEYRSLEHNRHGIAQRDGYIHTRTDTILPLLLLDRKELQYEMVNATCKAHLQRAEKHAANMKDALKTYDLYQQEIVKKIKDIKEIERHVDRITDRVIKQRFKMLALHGLSRTMAQRERDVAIAEDKLYHYTCAFNLQINENKRLREEIMDFLMERDNFFKMHNGIKRQIANAKKKMLNIVQLAIHTYDNRDEAMTKVKALREREEKEVKQHGMEVQEFERTLHHDKSILEFIKTKLKPRPAFEEAVDKRLRVGSAKERELDAILKRYRRSFKKILKFSHTKSILDLVDKYKTLDAGNYESFKYTSSINNECEVLREAVEVLKSKIEEIHTELEKQEREQRTSQEKLQMSIIGLQEKLKSMESQRVENKLKHRNFLSTISAAVTLAECNTMPIMRLLGNKDGINENNIRLCFTQLDIKITEMKVEQDRLKDIRNNSGNINTYKPAALAKSNNGSGGPFMPKAMVFRGESMDDEDAKVFEQEVYYYDEMKEYVFNKMVEDKIIDMKQRSVILSRSTLLEQSTAPSSMPATTRNSRKSLLEKVRQNETEGDIHVHVSKNIYRTETDGDDEEMVPRDYKPRHTMLKFDNQDPAKEITLPDSNSMPGGENPQLQEQPALPDAAEAEQLPSSQEEDAPSLESEQEDSPPSAPEENYPPDE